MSDAAHVGSSHLEVYKTPFKIAPTLISWPISDSYLKYEGGEDLPEKMDVWLVQETGDPAGGVISSKRGFEGNENAEIIALGYNTGKYYGAVGIGREDNFLQWGYHGPPSAMTDAGQKLFLNCIHYITKFKAK